MSDNVQIPSLIDEGVKNFLCEKLLICHDYKMTIFSYLMNSIYLIALVTVFIIILYISRNPKLTPYEKALKMQKDQEYIVSKIRDYKQEKKIYSSIITDLPIVQ